MGDVDGIRHDKPLHLVESVMLMGTRQRNQPRSHLILLTFDDVDVGIGPD